MPSRASYQIANREEGKVAQRDQSYRSCLLAMLTFFFLCIILILVSLPWKRSDALYHEYNDDHSETAKHRYGEHGRKTTTRPVEMITEREEPAKDDSYLNYPTSSETPETTSNTAISEFDIFTNTSNVTDNAAFERIISTEVSVETETLTAPMTNIESTTTDERPYDDSLTVSTQSIVNENTSEEYSSSTQSSASNSTTGSYYSTETNIKKIQTYGTEPSSITDKDFPTEIYETSTEMDNNTTVEDTPTGNIIESVKTTTDEIISIETRETNTVIESTTPSMPHNDSSKTPVTSHVFSTTSKSPVIENYVCDTGECKQLASKMLFYMNHSMDPCEDFYEYACGGFEANPQTIDQNLETISYQRIERQMQKDNHHGRLSLFTKYYNSCIEYENVDLAERIQSARSALNRVGKFYTTADRTKNHTSFTELLAKLLLHHSALLFDVTPDLNEYLPGLYTIKIGPTTYRSPFDTDKTEEACFADQFEREQKSVNLTKLYKEYKTCENNTTKFVKSITEALTALGVFGELESTYNISQYVNTTVINIDLEIIQTFFANYPPRNKIREAYLTKNYTRVSVEKLGDDCKIINWTQLFELLTKELVLPHVEVQVYFYDEFIQGLKSLYDFQTRDALQLNNALLGLYAHDLYQKLVVSKHRDVKKHCLRVATNLLIPEASSLYLSSFSNREIDYMNKSIHNIFNELKETLKIQVEKAEWTEEEGREALVQKINDLKVAVPDISGFTTSNYTCKRNEILKVNLTDNYFENSIILMQRYRALIYLQLFVNPGHSEEIGIHYATPFQSKGLAIYGLNLVVIPFGVIDWSLRYEAALDYIFLATLGTVIAHQIAHHFDANGIYYWNGTRNAQYSLLTENSFTDPNFENYIDCQRNVLYHNSMKMVVPSTEQILSYDMPQLTLNERLSEATGLRLAYDTLDRLRSRNETYLPWLNRNFDQLFYVAYAQMHCTKSPLTSSYISLYEDEQLPSRIRIFVSASNNKHFGKSWDCPEGSQIIPSFACDAFPYLDSDEASRVTMMRK